MVGLFGSESGLMATKCETQQGFSSTASSVSLNSSGAQSFFDLASACFTTPAMLALQPGLPAYHWPPPTLGGQGDEASVGRGQRGFNLQGHLGGRSSAAGEIHLFQFIVAGFFDEIDGTIVFNSSFSFCSTMQQ